MAILPKKASRCLFLLLLILDPAKGFADALRADIPIYDPCSNLDARVAIDETFDGIDPHVIEQLVLETKESILDVSTMMFEMRLLADELRQAYRNVRTEREASKPYILKFSRDATLKKQAKIESAKRVTNAQTHLRDRRKVIPNNFRTHATQYLESLVGLANQAVKALDSCPDQTCVKLVEKTVEARLKLGQRIMLHEKTRETAKEHFFESLLLRSCQDVYEDSLNSDSIKARYVARIYSQFVAVAQGQIAPKAMIEKTVGDIEGLKAMDLKLKKYSKTRIKSEMHWFSALGDRKIFSLNDPSVPFSQDLLKTGYARSYSLSCKPRANGDPGEVSVLISMDAGFNCTGEDGLKYTIHTYGGGAVAAFMSSIMKVQIISPRKISIEGTWVGAKSGFSLLGGFSFSVFPYIGKYGSMASFGQANFGVALQALKIEGMVIKPAAVFTDR